MAALDLRPRVVLHSPAGDYVIDPFGPGGTQLPPGFSYDIVWGQPDIPPGQDLLGNLGGMGLALLVILGALFLARR